MACGAVGPQSIRSTSSTRAALGARDRPAARSASHDPQSQNGFGQPSAEPVPSSVIAHRYDPCGANDTGASNAALRDMRRSAMSTGRPATRMRTTVRMARGMS